MPDLVYLLAVLVCPITMGAMMLVMMRGHQRHPSQASPDEVARLRAEVDELRAHAGADQPQAEPVQR